MPPTTRLCSGSCGAEITTWTHYVAPATGRNYYFCSVCAGSRLVACYHCGLMEFRSTATHRDLAANRYQAGLRFMSPAIPNPPLLSITRHDIVSLCAPCMTMCIWNCQHCGRGTFFYDRNPIEIDGVRFCTECARTRQPCTTCGETNPGRHAALHYQNETLGTACSGCISKGKQSSTFRVNKSRRLVGLEFECLVPRSAGWFEELLKFGRMKSDSSLHRLDGDGGNDREVYRAWELNTFPTNGDRLLETVQSVTSIMKAKGVLINRTCALHNHYDMRTLSDGQRNNITRWWNSFEPIFYGLADPERRKSIYCTPGPQRSHYGALNIIAFDSHGSFEVRIHEGTLDADRINGWLLVQLNFFDTFQDISSTPPVFQSNRERLLFFLQQCKIPLRLRKHMRKTLSERLTPAGAATFLSPTKQPTLPSTIVAAQHGPTYIDGYGQTLPAAAFQRLLDELHQNSTQRRF